MDNNNITLDAGGYPITVPSDIADVVRHLDQEWPDLTGTQKQIDWAESIRTEMLNVMMAALKTKYRIQDNILLDIKSGIDTMTAGVKEAFKTGFDMASDAGNKPINGMAWAYKRAKLYSSVASDLKKMDVLLQTKTTAKWWIENRNAAMHRKYITDDMTIAEMQKTGHYI